MSKNSTVLALKYRPSSFNELIGQDSITKTLTKAIEAKRLSHAYLFSGLRGSGKTSTARIFSKALICEHGPTSTPCNECLNCTLANENRHIDIIEMDAASSRKIDDIRDLIEQVKYRPNSARFKIFIIDEVHMLTKEAFNALLKTLEEPPPYVKFILATTDPLKLPATIISRTQHFRFKQIPSSCIITHLEEILKKEEVLFELEALQMLSKAGGGSLRDTLTLLDQAILYSNQNLKADDIASMLGLLTPEEIGNIFDAILQKDSKEIFKLIKEFEEYEPEVVIDELIDYLKDRFFEEDSKFSTLIYERFFRILSETRQLLSLNADGNFALALLFFKMVEALKLKDIQELIDSFENKELPKLPKDETSASFQAPAQKQKDEKSPYKTLVAKLYDRDFDLGECFEKEISFISYEDDILKLSSRAGEKCKQKLRNASSIIKHFSKEVFGLEARIEIVQDEEFEKELAPKKTVEEKPAENEGAPNAGCVTAPFEEGLTELDPNNILNDPFIQKASELFDAKKIEIHPKV